MKQRPSIAPSLCQCGCGERAPIAKRTRRDKGYVRGAPVAYVLGHNARRTPNAYDLADAGYDTPCWLWKRHLNRSGYGMVQAGKLRLAHRVYYERAKGTIPDGLTLDHLCRNRHCVNPDHLEPVTLKENIQRGWQARGGKRATGPAQICSRCGREGVRSFRVVDGKTLCNREKKCNERVQSAARLSIDGRENYGRAAA